jgi:predicted transcriptional regulator
MMTMERDAVWLVIVRHLRAHEPLHIDDITDTVEVSAKTARAILRVAQEAGLLRQESPQAQTWWPAIGPLGEVEDPEYRRAIETLIAEAPD